MNKLFSLAGNPNVGKSTIFNALTGLKQHTGNWTGKTVENAVGICKKDNIEYTIYDLPGTYSLISHSKEEEIARNFICFEKSDATVVVCDACNLERNLNLVLQTIEVTDNVIVCVNLMDEAKKKKINVNLERLSQILKVPVIGTSARSNKGLDNLLEEVNNYKKKESFKITYPKEIENYISKISEYLINLGINNNVRWLSLRLVCHDNLIKEEIEKRYNVTIDNSIFSDVPITCEDIVVKTIIDIAENISNSIVIFNNKNYNKRNQKIDKLLTSKVFGIPIMLMLFLFIFWLTIIGSNYPTSLLFELSSKLEVYLFNVCSFMPNWLRDPLILGVYKTLSWVVSVMLPPMAIFFPLFTILEDLGYLPRIAFNLDNYFKKCSSCGKQALTMSMGFGCNAVGVTGCRIIDSPRERLIAIITNSFVPCNGRFPMIIAIITMFFSLSSGILSSFTNALILIIVIIFGIGVTFLVSKILSKTLLKGVPSSFILELPPYRKPQVLKVIVRSIFNRTLFVLGRAIVVAAPAGLFIYLLSNVTFNGLPIVTIISNFLDPFANIIGLDGVILLAFILGFPANEIVVPIMLMIYLSTGTLTDYTSLSSLKTTLVDNGWTWLTAINVIIFSLLHFPCSTTCLTIKKETNSIKWMLVSILIPFILGVFLCFVFTSVVRILGLI